jgi:predicted DsbA family dithiol-disulfide isomerase
MFDNVEAAARSSGIPLDFARITRYSNTLKAHTLIRHAAAKGVQRALVDDLFTAYFLEGRDVGDAETLSDIARRHGFAPAEAEGLIADAKETERSLTESGQAMALGIRGVPFYIFGNRLAFSGAQASETFVSAIEKALTEAVAAKDADEP